MSPTQLAAWYAWGRRGRSRRNTQFTAADWPRVERLVREDWSPEQIAGWLRRQRLLRISDETIYRWIWTDKRAGGQCTSTSAARGNRSARAMGPTTAAGGLADKRPIATRPPGAAQRSRFGPREGDTMLGAGWAGPCVLTLVERRYGYVTIGKRPHRAAPFVNRGLHQLIQRQPRPVRTLTVDNGTGFHSCRALQTQLPTRFYFATRQHSWEHGTNEDTSGLLHQYLPKGQSRGHLTQHDCNRIARKLNRRPRKRLGYPTPKEYYVP